jgi:hypothetical protein
MDTKLFNKTCSVHFIVSPPEHFELAGEPEVAVIIDDAFFDDLGVPGSVGKYPSPVVLANAVVGGVLALEVFGSIIVVSGL